MQNMNIHVFFNKGQETLLENHFRKTLLDDWPIICHESSLPNAFDFGTQGFMQIILGKMSA